MNRVSLDKADVDNNCWGSKLFTSQYTNELARICILYFL